MIDKNEFRETGYVYDSIENYSELIDVDEYKNCIKKLMSFNLKRHSVREYWFKHKKLSYKEYIHYDDLLKDDDNLDMADYVFQKGHEYELKKIDECGFYPTWVFGKNKSNKVSQILYNDPIKTFQMRFINKYYPERVSPKGWENTAYNINMGLQYYDKGCLIDTHDDGAPKNRICVFLFFLNDEWEESNGGNLLLFENKELAGTGYSGEIDTTGEPFIPLKPIFPNFLVLDSEVNLVHEVEKVKNGTRYSAVNFFANEDDWEFG